MRRPAGEAGVTLIELLIAMAVMIIILSPIVTSFALTLTTTTSADQDVSNSADAQGFTSFFDTDIGNADTVTVTTAPGALAATCGGAGSSEALTATWLDGARQHVVAYQATVDAALGAVLAAAGPVYRISRFDCTAGSPPGPVVLARSASSLPAWGCDGVLCSTGLASTTPRRVSLTLTELPRKTTDPSFLLTLTATRRVTP